MSFGDSTPEDAWDPDDPVAELIDNLGRRLAAILALRVIDEAVQARLSWLAADLEHVGRRVHAGRIGRVGG